MLGLYRPDSVARASFALPRSHHREVRLTGAEFKFSLDPQPVILTNVLYECVLFQHFLACVLLLQSALQPLWVLACSTIVEYSQQEGFYRVPLPAALQTPNLEDQ